MKKLLLYGILALIVIIIGAFILLGRYTDRVIDPYVRSLLENTRPMHHRIDYKKIRVNLWARYIVLKEVWMYPDSTLTENDMQIEVMVDDIRLTGFRLKEMLFDKTLILDDIVIENPNVIITLPVKPEEVIEEVSEKEVRKEKAQLLTRISLKGIILSGGSFYLVHHNAILASSPDINVTAEDIELKKNSRDEPVGFTYGDFTISLSELDLFADSSLYSISLDKFTANKKSSIITMNGLSIIPNFDKKEFSRNLEFQNDRFDIKIGEMKITHTGINKLLEDQPLEITRLVVDSVDADIYRDKNVPFNPDRFPPFYNESFMKIPIPVKIDTLEITNSTIQYGELVAGRPVAGEIMLENFNARSYNLTNLVEEDSIENVMHLYVQARVMGEGSLNAQLILPLEGNMHDFECSGSVGTMKLSPLNDMLEPSINMKFNDGTVNRMTFYFTANDRTSNGWMEFLYSGIDVVLLKKEPDKQWGFVSLLANTLTLSNNPAPGKDLKIVKIGYERDRNKGIINYIWKTIQSGMVRTIIPTGKYTINKKNADLEIEKGTRNQKKKRL